MNMNGRENQDESKEVRCDVSQLALLGKVFDRWFSLSDSDNLSFSLRSSSEVYIHVLKDVDCPEELVVLLQVFGDVCGFDGFGTPEVKLLESYVVFDSSLGKVIGVQSEAGSIENSYLTSLITAMKAEIERFDVEDAERANCLSRMRDATVSDLADFRPSA